MKIEVAKPTPVVAKAFCDDDDEDNKEEMPIEAKMKMRNIGRYARLLFFMHKNILKIIV